MDIIDVINNECSGLITFDEIEDLEIKYYTERKELKNEISSCDNKIKSGRYRDFIYNRIKASIIEIAGSGVGSMFLEQIVGIFRGRVVSCPIFRFDGVDNNLVDLDEWSKQKHCGAIEFRIYVTCQIYRHKETYAISCSIDQIKSFMPTLRLMLKENDNQLKTVDEYIETLKDDKYKLVEKLEKLENFNFKEWEETKMERGLVYKPYIKSKEEFNSSKELLSEIDEYIKNKQ